MIPASVVITGGTGSLGRALVTRWHGVSHRLVIVSRDEWKHADMAREFPADDGVRYFVGDVRDRSRLADAFRGCLTVVHAAALKRIDTVAYNPAEAVKTNILGTLNVIQAAAEAGCERVLLISSDKAAAPCNAYGASKLMAEYVAVQANATTWPRGLRVSALRYGNVIGSRGSVVPLWRDALRANGALPVTDFRMTRFLLTLDDAVGLVERALDDMEGGEVFIPQLPAASMLCLAQALTGDRFLALESLGGLRPGGEKLHESLLTEHEAPRAVSVDGWFILQPTHRTWTETGYGWARHGYEAVTSEYRSDSAPQLTVDEVRAMLQKAGMLDE